ncbi:MAG: helix-turn-helix transcriptional regulator [Pyrinomonadaceae bacterium]
MRLKIRINERCKAQGITTAYQLQKKANLTPPTASRAFNNEVKQFTIETLEKLCAALGCTPNEILTPAEGKKKSHK